MRCEKIILPKTGVELTTYLTDNEAVESERRRPLVLIFPGGGYFFRSPREAEPIALRLLSLGLQCAIVAYSVAPARHPTALHEAGEAMVYARAHAEEWLCDKNMIAVLGFSAGGHAAAHLGVRWQTLPWGKACRPDAMILCYPVISAGEHAHRDSFRNLLGENHDALCDSVSLEKLVSKNTPPTFLWHTWEDDLVPVENSLLFAAELRRNGIPCEMHIWQHGCHGLSLSNDEAYPLNDQHQQPACREWPEMAARWLKEI